MQNLSSHHEIRGAIDSIDERVAASKDVVELGLGDRVVHVDAGEQQLASLVHLVQTLHSGGGLLRHALDVGHHLVPVAGMALLQTLQQSVDNLQLRVVRVLVQNGGVVLGLFFEKRNKTHEMEKHARHQTHLESAVDQQSGVSSVVDEELARLRVAKVQRLPGGLPVLFQRLALPGKHGHASLTKQNMVTNTKPSFRPCLKD